MLGGIVPYSRLLSPPAFHLPRSHHLIRSGGSRGSVGSEPRRRHGSALHHRRQLFLEYLLSFRSSSSPCPRFLLHCYLTRRQQRCSEPGRIMRRVLEGRTRGDLGLENRMCHTRWRDTLWENKNNKYFSATWDEWRTVLRLDLM